MSTRRRLVLALVAVAGFAFAALIAWQQTDLRPRYLATMEEALVDAAQLLAAQVAAHIGPAGIDQQTVAATFAAASRQPMHARIYDLDKVGLDAWVYLTDAQGRVLYHGREPETVGQDWSAWRDVACTLRGEYGARVSWLDFGEGDEEVLHIAAPVHAADGQLAGVLTLCKPSGSIALFLAQARRSVLVAAGLAAAFLVVAGLLVTWWLTEPIAHLTTYVEAMQTGERRAPPGLGGSDIAALGRAFERMRDALDGKAYIEAYVQTLTHEMKSPLAGMRAAAELLGEDLPAGEREKFLTNLRGETARLQDLLERLLLLAGLERRRSLDRPVTLDLLALCREVADNLTATSAQRGVTIGVTGPAAGDATVLGEVFLLRQAITNLVQNAIDFSLSGTTVTVAITRHEQQCTITVADRGTGIPDYALPRLFERFYSLPRPTSGRKGTGLGLPLVREVATLHRGSVELRQRAGGGAEALFHLPST